MKIIDLPLADTIAYAAKRSAVAASDPAVEASVAAILTAVRTEGDAAIRRYEKQFDNADLTDLRVPQSAIDDAYANAPQDLIAALELAKRNIISYHQKEKATGFVDTEQPGVMRGERITPLAAVGVYVPGGTAAYPSSILMNVLPAKIAGVARIALVTPPQADGLNQSVLTAARLPASPRCIKSAARKPSPPWPMAPNRFRGR